MSEAINCDDGPISDTGKSYRQILKSTAMMGGSSVVNVAFAVIRSKAIAVMLGAEGVGVMGLFTAVLDLAQTLSGLGMQSSGVRQIAEASQANDQARLAAVVRALTIASLALGLAGGAMLVLLAKPIAGLTFGNTSYAAAVALLGLGVVFRVVSGGQLALVQGMRQISQLAQSGICASFLSTLICIPTIYVLGIEGVVPSIVAMAAASMVLSWWFARKNMPDGRVGSLAEVGAQAVALSRLGAIFLVTGLLTFGAAYVIRIIVLHAEGAAGAGYFQAAWAVGGLFAGFILQAMGTDFYPRLTAVAHDNVECNRLVNEQAQVSMLLAAPGLLATLTLAPLVMTIFYTSEFMAGVGVLRWVCLGMMLRIVAWPMGFIIIAKDAQRVFFWTEVAATFVHVGLAFLLVRWIGLAGAGIAFFGLYVWHGILVFVLVRRLTGFQWSPDNIRLMAQIFAATFVTFVGCELLPIWQATLLGGLTTLATGLYALSLLMKVVPEDWLPEMVRARLSRAR